MSGEEVVLDSNVLIDLLKGDAAVRETIRGLRTRVSFITEVELLSWPGSTGRDMDLMTALLVQSMVMPFDPSIKAVTIQLRRTTKLKLPDCFVAAAAIVADVPLITRDKGFKKIAHLLEVRLV
jgi:hypothetical protein